MRRVWSQDPETVNPPSLDTQDDGSTFAAPAQPTFVTVGGNNHMICAPLPGGRPAGDVGESHMN